MKNNININGKSYNVSGNNVSVVNGKVIVDGVEIEKNLSGEVTIIWQGSVANLDCTSCQIKGDVLGDVDGTTINCTGDINGDVDGTTINCKDINGDVEGVTINCKNNNGDIKM